MRAKEYHETEVSKAKLSRAVTNQRDSTPRPRQRKFKGNILLTPTKKRRKESARVDDSNDK
jgi:hypothetical protein